MSDHPMEAVRNLKRIFICDDVCLDAFCWLTPTKVGLALAFVSDRFDALVDMHFRSRKWALGKFKIVQSAADGTAQIIKLGSVNKETLPIAQMPLPNGIIGFERIECVYISADVIAFLQRIERLLSSDITLTLDYSFLKFLLFCIKSGTLAWPLLLRMLPSIVKMRCKSQNSLENFRAFFSPSIPCGCANLRLITYDYGKFIRFPPDDSAGASEGQLLCKWLHTPRTDGQPKVFRMGMERHIQMGELRTAFLSATTSVSFIILLPSFHSVAVPFELENWGTRERLACRTIGRNGPWWLIERCPIGKSAAGQWTEWVEEALDEGNSDWKVFGFGH